MIKENKKSSPPCRWYRSRYPKNLVPYSICKNFDPGPHTVGLVRDWSKFTGYLGRVLGKICLKNLIFSQKKYPPLFLVKKSLRPLIFFEKNSSLSYCISPKNSLIQSHENHSKNPGVRCGSRKQEFDLPDDAFSIRKHSSQICQCPTSIIIINL